ncbi:MAG: hypothetical protein J3Q66DRAFT_327178 [Benniella sp.]|nr:MAG: hypothetical protein J3Q66DRAFT_327178 [Benniella sp.]
MNTFISFHDLTLEARFLWASPAIFDLLGYEPEDLSGVGVYEIIFPEDVPDGRTAHKENVMNELVATQVVVRYKHKDGHFVHFLACFGICYDFVLNVATMLDLSAEAYVQRRVHSSAMTRMVGSKKEEFERVKRHHEAFAKNSWNHQAMEPEPRVCLILNRFTRNLSVMYASSACEMVFNVDPDEITGKPILLYIRSDDLASFVSQVDMARASTVITQIRFWFQSPNQRWEIPCEAIIIGAADGIVAVVRRCRPFVRKHFITSGGERFEASYPNSSWSSSRTRSYGSSPGATLAPSPTSTAYGSYDIKHPSPPRNVTRDLLNNIRILELDEDDTRVRPLTEFPQNDPSLVPEITAVAEVPAFKEVVAQYYDEGDDDDDYYYVEDRFKRLAVSPRGDGGGYGGFDRRE